MRTVILIDGPSGSGKTTFAEKLSAAIGFRVVHLDDMYPGWGGLAEGSRMVASDVLAPQRPGFRRWDWQRSRPGQWEDLDARDNLIIEGVGAVTADTIAAAARGGDVITVRINGPAELLRKRRALKRDPYYEPWWDTWAAQERIHFQGPGNVPVDLEL